MKQLHLSLSLIFILIATTYTSQSYSSNLESELQSSEFGQTFMETINKLDLENENIKFKYKSGGTSVGFRFEFNNKVYKWAPKNSATNPETQVVSYQLARFLQIENLVIPSTYFTLGPKATEQFKILLENAKEKNSHRIGNRDGTLKAIGSGASLTGVITPQLDPKEFEVANLVDAKNNTINKNHRIAKLIRGSEVQPDTDTTMELVRKKGIESEIELAKQFSNILILDALTAQWDRWSGGNVEAKLNNSTNRVQFIARDNGGASMTGGEKHVSKTLSFVSRFDSNTIDRLTKLKQFLIEDKTAEFTKMLGLRTNSKSLVDRIDRILKHVDEQKNRFGEANIFFQ